jgi:hypothetical protein
MRLQSCFLILIPFLFLSACAPEIGLRLRVPTLPEPAGVADATISTDPIKVRVGNFMDARPTQTFVLVDGRKVGTDGSLENSVRDGFTRYLRQSGTRIALLDAPSIEGEVQEWTAVVRPSFPNSDAQASARLKVTVRDSRAHPIYFATFSGESSMSHPMVDEAVVQRLLGQAMGSAIEAAVKDPEFVAQLSKGRIR